jgi:hypothetical protein
LSYYSSPCGGFCELFGGDELFCCLWANPRATRIAVSGITGKNLTIEKDISFKLRDVKDVSIVVEMKTRNLFKILVSRPQHGLIVVTCSQDAKHVITF